MIRTQPMILGALALAVSATLGAQQPAPTAAPSNQDPMDTTRTISVAGCVKPHADPMPVASGSPTGGRGQAPASPSATTTARFMLDNVEHVESVPLDRGRSNQPNPMPGGAPPRPPALSVAKQYVLIAETPGLNLAAHLNHQVEVTGRVTVPSTPRGDKPPSSPGAVAPRTDPDPSARGGGRSSSPADNMPGASGTPQASRAVVTMPTLTVSSVRMVSAMCR
jgi:hypothetical protein